MLPKIVVRKVVSHSFCFINPVGYVLSKRNNRTELLPNSTKSFGESCIEERIAHLGAFSKELRIRKSKHNS